MSCRSLRPAITSVVPFSNTEWRCYNAKYIAALNAQKHGISKQFIQAVQIFKTVAPVVDDKILSITKVTSFA